MTGPLDLIISGINGDVTEVHVSDFPTDPEYMVIYGIGETLPSDNCVQASPIDYCLLQPSTPINGVCNDGNYENDDGCSSACSVE